MFEKEIQGYEALLKVYREKVTDRMAMDDLKEYNEILFQLIAVPSKVIPFP